ncbi:MAG: TIM barrel protein [Chloroflexi bacterium]|nr:TIM barrel protein [Chloroflexota bacterium]
MRFDANISILFPGLPVAEQLTAAAATGFDAIEMWWPFAVDVPSDREVDRLVGAVRDAGLALVCLNLALGDRAAGQHGLVAVPGARHRFRDHVDVAVGIAGRLGGRVLNALYANVPPDVPREQLDDIAVENLAFAAIRARSVGAIVALEALNPVDFPRYGLHRTAQSVALADRVQEEADAEVGILFDVYNVQRSEGDLIARIDAHAARFVHVQIADVPGRLRPGTGEVAFDRVLPALERAGYDGFVGLEYRPSPDPNDTFAWLPSAERRSGASAGPRAGAS